MKLIIAQGNPGSEYKKTRHNIGWLALDAIANELNADDWQQKTKFHGFVAPVTFNDSKALLLKPTTFYNDTGRAVRTVTDFYNLQPSDILVLHDELALPRGSVRVRPSGSSAGNNGVKSISSHLGSEEYWRLRIGIKPNHQVANSSQYVLNPLSLSDQEALKQLQPTLILCVKDFLNGSLKAHSFSLPETKA